LHPVQKAIYGLRIGLLPAFGKRNLTLFVEAKEVAGTAFSEGFGKIARLRPIRPALAPVRVRFRAPAKAAMGLNTGERPVDIMDNIAAKTELAPSFQDAVNF